MRRVREFSGSLGRDEAEEGGKKGGVEIES